MRTVRVLCVIMLVVLLAAAALAQRVVSVQRYLDFAKASADWTWAHYDSLATVWQKTIDPDNVFGYRPPPRFLEMAAIYGYLYEVTGRKVYAERAKKVLLTYDDYRVFYPDSAARKRADYEDGVPALPDIFTTMRYVRAYDSLKRKGFITAAEQREIENIIGESIDYLFRTQEWGAMNRGILRAETLAWAIRAVPHHPKVQSWRILEEAIGADNWGNWEIEDASLYNAVWLYSLLSYADAKGTLDELFRLPEMYYYARYFLHLMCPDGMIPDFGDSHWRSNWSRYLVFFEAAARAYQAPELKWAASTIAERFLDLRNLADTGLAYLLLDCYRFGTDKVSPQVPTALSCEVMEDEVGKKVVFRNGWEHTSTYLLLNYKDEGDAGLLFRDYLRDTIPVEEEKMTHGHADENSIVLLMANGSLLLHDGGYRDYMPSGPFGAYRQDYFHNRVCVRQEKIFMGQRQGQYRYSVRDAVPGQAVLDFLHNAGSYREVRTQKVDFITLPEFDYSRTRVIDDLLGYEHDRIVTYVKEPELFVVFDVVKARVPAFFTASNLWHTRKVVAQGEHWYDTVYDSLQTLAFPIDTHLLIMFPEHHYKLEGVERERRYYQNELVIHQTTGQHFELGQTIAFVTVLIPHLANVHPEELVGKVRYVEPEPEGKGLMVEIREDDRVITVGAKRDLRMDMVRDWRRPKYTYESGKIRYGAFETNGDFVFFVRSGDQLSYTAVNISGARYGEQVLYAPKPALFGLAFDGSPDMPGVGKIRYWRDRVQLQGPRK